jgi:hypothetical protein
MFRGLTPSPSSGCAGGVWVVPQLSVLVLTNHQQTLRMGTKSAAETSENLHILMRLSARKNFIVVICSRTHVSGKWSVPIISVSVVTNMSPEMDPGRGDRRALRSLCFDLTVAWLTAGKLFTESNSGDGFKLYTDNRQCVLLSVCREQKK